MRTRYVRPLTNEERVALETLYREGHLHHERRRAHFILLSAAGQHLKAAAELVGMSRKTAGRTLRQFEADGVAGLLEPKRPGRRSQVTAAILAELEVVLARSPREQGLPANNWSSPVLCQHLARQYGLRFSDDQALRILRKLGYRQVRPRPRLAKGDPQAK